MNNEKVYYVGKIYVQDIVPLAQETLLETVVDFIKYVFTCGRARRNLPYLYYTLRGLLWGRSLCKRILRGEVKDE